MKRGWRYGGSDGEKGCRGKGSDAITTEDGRTEAAFATVVSIENMILMVGK